jgi:hypothetical protein
MDSIAYNTNPEAFVVIYLNHGNRQTLGGHTLAITTNHFASMASDAVRDRRLLLFVFDAHCSTLLARKVWRLVGERLRQPLQGTLGRYVGFLTSGVDFSLTSAIVLSKDPDLVSLFDKKTKATDGEFAHGYRIHNSMFSRQFIDIWAHLLKKHRRIAIHALPALMNPPAERRTGTRDVRYGFEAAFVGDPQGLGALPFRSFFPLGWPAASAAPIPGSRLVVRDVIPDTRMGGFYDDMVCFWDNPGHEQTFQWIFVEIQKTPNGQTEVVPGDAASPRRLDRELGPEHPIFRYISSRASAERRVESVVERAPKVPWDMLYGAFRMKARGMGWQRQVDPPVPDPCLCALEGQLAAINGAPLPPWTSTMVYWMAGYGSFLGDDKRFLEVIKSAQEDMLSLLQEEDED